MKNWDCLAGFRQFEEGADTNAYTETYTIGIPTSICHAQQSGSGVFQLEILVGKF